MLLGLGGCDDRVAREAHPPVRYRLTAEVDTPQGLRTGSSVIEVQWSSPPEALGTQGTASYKVKGEALAVDLPHGETLFVLARSPFTGSWAALVPASAGIVNAEGINPSPRPVPRQLELPSGPMQFYPYFVRFRDIADPTSIERVDPDDLAATFGEGTKLKGLTVQITEDPMTQAMERRLPWADRLRGLHLDGTSAVATDMNGNDLSSQLTPGDFSTELAR